MKKKLLAAIMAVAFVAASAALVYAFNCDVVKIEGGEVVIKCDPADAATLVVGKPVKVKKKTEGC